MRCSIDEKICEVKWLILHVDYKDIIWWFCAFCPEFTVCEIIEGIQKGVAVPRLALNHMSEVRRRDPLPVEMRSSRYRARRTAWAALSQMASQRSMVHGHM
jgi:hypothetical protein